MGVTDDLKGQVPLALIVLKVGVTDDVRSTVVADCGRLVREAVGPVAAFHNTIVAARLPKTRSGKVLRATLRSIADGEPYKIPATIEDVSVLDEVRRLTTVRYRRISLFSPRTNTYTRTLSIRGCPSTRIAD